MILKFLLEPLILLAEFIVNLVPAFPRFDSLQANLSPIAYILQFVNIFVDLQFLSKCMLIILVVYNLKFGWSILMFVIKKIPGIS